MPFGRARKNVEPLEEGALFDYAVASLGRRMRTVSELKRLMKLRVEAGAAGEAKMDAVVARLKEYKFLNDEAFASEFTRLRQENEKFGKRRVRQQLMQKGVHADVVTQTVDAAYEGLSEEDLVRQHLLRKRVKKPANQKETGRVMRLLMRAGFSMGAIVKVLKAWDVDEDSLSAIESSEDEEAPPVE
jgi:regulatory protein